MLANDEVTTVQNIAVDVEQNNFEKSVPGNIRTDISGLDSVKTDNSVGEIRLNGDIITVIYHVLMLQ
jgi:hypothetical protein